MKHTKVLMLALFILPWMSGVSEAQQDTLRVPSASYGDITEALDAAQAGNLILVSNNGIGNPAYEPFTMKIGVQVSRAMGQEPRVSADGGTHAVAFPLDSDTLTVLDGFTILGGDTTVVMRDEGILRNCTIDDDGDGTQVGVYHFRYGGNIKDVDITLDVSGVDARGILLHDSEATVENCTVRIPHSTSQGVGIKTELQYFMLDPTISKCFVTAPSGIGIDTESGLVQYCTVDSTNYAGIHDSGSTTIIQCIVGPSGSGGINGYGPDVSYCIAPSFSLSGGSGTGNSTDDPLFCDLAGGEYTLRVDSWGNPEINGYGLIGRYPVSCMYGTLQRDATYTAGGTLDFTGDAVIPDTTDLTLGAGTTLDIASTDGEAGGTDTQKVELIVEDGATLTVQGGSGNPVLFRSVAATEGDWYGVHVKEGGAASIEYADFQHATLAAIYQSEETGSISHCTFSNNEERDIIVGEDQHGLDLTIAHDTLTVGGGSGIELEVSVTGVAVDTNRIIGNSSSYAGIFAGLVSDRETPTYTGNTISGFSTGGGIRDWNSDATMTMNTISNCNWGIQLRYGSPIIGLANDSSSDNIIQSNGTGIMCDSTAAPTIRNNQIKSNGYGVVAQHQADPDMGTNSTHQGKNTLTDNTYYCILNRNTSGTLSAEYNFFGTEAGCPPPGCTSGNVDFTNWLCTEPASVEMTRVLAEPRGLRLLGAGPNPMTGSGKIFFSLEDGQARLHGQVFDVSGRVVRDLGEVVVGPGTHVFEWDGRSDVGNPVRSGIYFVRIKATNGFQGTTKLLVAR